MRKQQGVVLVADLGGSSLRVALVGADGEMDALCVIPLSLGVETIGTAEGDPEQWWQRFAAAVNALEEQSPAKFAGVRAIAISAFTRSQVIIDRDGEVVGPTLLWRDARAGAVVADVMALTSPDHPERDGLSAFHPLARLAWLKKEQPKAYARAAVVLEPKDFLNLRLTGRAVSDTVSMARLAACARPGPSGRSLLAETGVAPDLLPALLPPVSIMGHVRKGHTGALGRLTGVPVIAMANDTWASVVGLGALEAGVAYNLSGTTEVLGVAHAQPAVASGLLSVDWSCGVHQLGGPSQCGGDTLVWLMNLFGDGQGSAFGSRIQELLAGPRAPEPLLFLPYLEGERTPYWNPDLRGAFIGLNRRHGPTDFAFAVLEGIAFLNRLVLERAEGATGTMVREIRFGGGGASNAVWRAIKADVMNRPVLTVEGAEQGLAGAAIAAWTALGEYSDLVSAQAALVRVAERRLPDPGRHHTYDRLYTLWCSADVKLADLSRDLQEVRL